MTEKTIALEGLPAEMELMLSLALGDIPRELPAGLDAGAFRALVEKNRLTPLAARGLGRMKAGTLPPELTALRDMKNTYALICMGQIQALAALMEAFEKKGLRVISMKGPILAMELYGDPSLRYSRDLDLLAAPEEFEAACAVLEEQGYRPEVTIWNKTPLRRRLLEKRGEEMHRCYEKNGLCVELHWRLSFRLDEGFESLWAGRRIKTLMGRSVPCLGEADELPYLVCHAAGHAFQRLRWLLDLHRLQELRPGFFPDTYRLMARQGTGMLLMAAMLVMYRLGLPMEDVDDPLFSVTRQGNRLILRYADQVRDDARQGMELADRVWPLLFARDESLGLAGRRYQTMLPTLGRRRSLLDVLSPGRYELELMDLPDRWYFLYYLIRPFCKLWRLLSGQ